MVALSERDHLRTVKLNQIPNTLIQNKQNSYFKREENGDRKRNILLKISPCYLLGG
jgi:hypothetical protein